MTIDKIAETMKLIKDSGQCPFEFIDGKASILEAELDALGSLRKFYEKHGVPSEWKENPAPAAASSPVPRANDTEPTYKITPKAAPPGAPIATKIAQLLATEGPKRVSQIVNAGICSDPTARNHLKAPYFAQRADLSYEITNIGKAHYLGQTVTSKA